MGCVQLRCDYDAHQAQLGEHDVNTAYCSKHVLTGTRPPEQDLATTATIKGLRVHSTGATSIDL